MAKHTSGPWHRNIKPASKYTTIFAGRNTHVAHVGVKGLTEEEIEANCDLITAAPDMHEQLIVLTGLLVEHAPHEQEAIQKAQLAIAKAEGREHD